MKTIVKSAVIATALSLMLMADVPPFLKQHVPPLFDQLVPEANAILGVRRRTRRRTAVVVGSAAAASTAAANQQAAAAQQQTAAAQQQAAAAEQEAAAAKQQAATPPQPQAAAAGQPLPLGTVIPALPSGCTPTPVGGVEYYYCGGNFYRAVFQGNQLVYVTTKPK